MEKKPSSHVCTTCGLTSKSREGLLSLERDRRPEDRLRDHRRPFLISLTWAYKGSVDSDDVFASSMDFFIRVASITKHQFFREIMFDLGIIDQIRRSKNRSSWILNMTTDEVGGEKHSRKPCCEILRCWSCLPSTTSSSTLRSLSGVISMTSSPPLKYDTSPSFLSPLKS